MKLSERQKSEKIQEHPLIIFDVDQPVKLKKEYEQTNGGKSLRGRVNSIRIDRNGIWYNVIYNAVDEGMSFQSTDLLAIFLEADGRK